MVPKRRPPRPHSLSWSRSPLRQCAAAKPSQVTSPNSATKTISATQFTSVTETYSLESGGSGAGGSDAETASVVGREINDGGQHRADQNGGELIPVEKRQAKPRWLDRVVERRPDDAGELHDEQQVPPAPAAAF